MEEFYGGIAWRNFLEEYPEVEEFLKNLSRGTPKGFHGGISGRIFEITYAGIIRRSLEKSSEKFLYCFSGEISSVIP